MRTEDRHGNIFLHDKDYNLLNDFSNSYYMIGLVTNISIKNDTDIKDKNFKTYITPLCHEASIIEKEINDKLPKKNNFIWFSENTGHNLNSSTSKEKQKEFKDLVKDELVIFKSALEFKSKGSGTTENLKNYFIYKNISDFKIISKKNTTSNFNEEGFERIPFLEKTFDELENLDNIELIEYPTILEQLNIILCKDGLIKSTISFAKSEKNIFFWKKTSDLELYKFNSYTIEELKEKLKNAEEFEISEYKNTNIVPKYILCKDGILYFKKNMLETGMKNEFSWKLSRMEKEIDIFENIKSETFIKASDNTYFFEKELLKNFFYERDKKIEINKKDKSIIENKINDEKVIKEKNIEKKVTTKKITKKSEDVNMTKIDKKINTELNFINSLIEDSINKNLCYNDDDLINLHISIKTNMITVLSGMTGTGKSQLAQIYAETLCKKENIKFIPITPSYLEPSDMLGYYNPNMGIFTPADTDLVDFLVKAQKKQNEFFVIIFDEMNLSQVEHWFAPFLSLLELEEDKRELFVYSKNNRCLNDEKYPATVHIGNNIRIIGTINLDETIKEFSDRLLDRTNIIRLGKRKFVDLINMKSINTTIKTENTKIDVFKEYNSWIKQGYLQNIFTKEELNFFDELHSIIDKVDSKKGVSFRVLQAIAIYLENIPKNDKDKPMFERKKAIDIQVKQRIISKLRGNKKTMNNLLGDYDEEKNICLNSLLYNFLDKNNKISSFEETKELILQKSKEVSIYGYTY